MRSASVLWLAVAIVLCGQEASGQSSTQVPQWGLFETTITNSTAYQNPFVDVELSCVFTAPSGRRISFPGFYDGNGQGGQTGNVWKQRFMPDELGSWSYAATFSDGSPGKAGSFTCVSTGAKRGPWRQDPSNARWFKTANGERLLPSCFYAFGQFATVDWQDAINWCKARGYNTYFTATFNQWAWGTGWSNVTAWVTKNAATKEVDYSRYNIPMWRDWDAMIKTAGDNGIYIAPHDGPTGLYGGREQGYPPAELAYFPAVRERFDTPRNKRLIKYLVARQGAFWNIAYWDLYAGEIYEFKSESEVIAYGEYFASLDPWGRMITAQDIEQARNGTDLRWLAKMNIPSSRKLNSVQVGNPNDPSWSASALNSFALSVVNRGFPVINTEGLWEGQGRAQKALPYIWGFFAAGAHTLWADWNHEDSANTLYGSLGKAWIPVKPLNQRVFLTSQLGANTSGDEELKIATDYLKRFEYWKMSSSNSLVSGGAEAYCLAEPGKQYIVYAPSGGTVRVNLSGVSGTFAAEWLDPRNGNRSSAGTVTGGAARTFGAPGSQDWVLGLTRSSTGNQPPTVTLTAPASGASFTQGTPIDLQANASDPDGSIVRVDFLAGGTVLWTEVQAPYTYTWNNAAVGTHGLTAVATDDQGATTTSSAVNITVSAPAGSAPTATISSPADGAEFTPGATLSYSGTGSDPEDGALTGGSLAWELDRMGDGLGPVHTSTGDSGTYTFPAGIPPDTEYRLTLTATDSGGLSDSKNLTLWVRSAAPPPPPANEAPTATVSSPADGTEYLPGGTLTYSGTGSDPEDGALTGGSLAWELDLIGDGLGPVHTSTGGAGSYSFPGDITQDTEYRLTLTVTDSGGLIDSKTVILWVRPGAPPPPPPPTNQAPTGTISSPADGAEYAPGGTLIYSGTGTDPEDGALTGASLGWELDRMGDGLGPVHASTGSSGSYGFPGNITQDTEYRLTLTATDSGGLNDSKTVTLWVRPGAPPPPPPPPPPTNQTPTASILSPAGGAEYAPGGVLSYSGTGSDPEDGVLAGASLSWELDRMGDGVGPVHTSTGGAGSYGFPGNITQDTEYRLKLTVTDFGGLIDSASVTLWVRTGGAGIAISNTTPASYVWDTLNVGSAQYIDRAYTFSGVPAGIVGFQYLRTANDDKGSTGGLFITFDVNQDVTVYVAHDDRFAVKPAWMGSFVDTGEDLSTDDPGGTTFSLWAAAYSAGTVALGGNTTDGVSQNSMYTVVVGPPGGATATDSDGDGLPDAWETTHFNGLSEGAGGDPDGDGATNLEEFQAGTDPMDPGSGPAPAPGPGPGPAAGGSGGSEGGEGCGATGFEALLVLLLVAYFRGRRKAGPSGAA